MADHSSQPISVSVIIPVFNTEDYLSDCLDSVLDQSLSDIEILCVNDGSTDNSALILAKYANLDERITIINKPNGGLSSARNTGLDRAQGKYIVFLDSDDMIKPQTLESCFTTCENGGLQAIFFDAEALYETINLFEQHPHYCTYYQRSDDYPAVLGGRELFVHLIEKNEFRSSVDLAMISRAFIESNGLRFVEGIYYEDNIFMFQLMAADPKSKKISDRYYVRRVRGGSIMSMEYTKQHLDSAKYVYKFLSEHIEYNARFWPQEFVAAGYCLIEVLKKQYTTVYDSFSARVTQKNGQ
jgi:glycosyltransferase involved in cell wall biosynthesis